MASTEPIQHPRVQHRLEIGRKPATGLFDLDHGKVQGSQASPLRIQLGESGDQCGEGGHEAVLEWGAVADDQTFGG